MRSFEKKIFHFHKNKKIIFHFNENIETNVRCNQIQKRKIPKNS